MKVTVKQHHIDNGKPTWTDHCPIALAIKEQIGGADVSVGIVSAGITTTTEYTRYNLPRSAQRFITKFDKKVPVKPFSFTMKLESVF